MKRNTLQRLNETKYAKTLPSTPTFRPPCLFRQRLTFSLVMSHYRNFQFRSISMQYWLLTNFRRAVTRYIRNGLF